MSHRILQIGSGSMGSRRIRDLSARGDVEMALFEIREDRRERAHEQFRIACFSSLPEALAWKPDMVVISTPPHMHDPYVEMALEHNLPFFCEADIWTYDYRKIGIATSVHNIIAAPSFTFYFLPIIHEVRRIVQNELGALHAYSMCLSVDGPNWHPEEGIEYYARHRDTSAGREMVPFELLGLDYIFGEPTEVKATIQARANVGVEDTWCLQMQLDNGATGELNVFMVIPQPMRKGWGAGSNGFVEFDLLTGDVTRRLPSLGLSDTRNFGRLSDIIERVYANEINAFVEAVKGGTAWPIDFRKGSVITGTLAAAEKSAATGRSEKINPDMMPQRHLDFKEWGSS